MPREKKTSAAGAAVPGANRKDSDGASPASRLNIGRLYTAEMLFEAGEKSADSDYHKNMDADMFEQWLEKRFLPTFRKKYPGKRAILVLDNAAYHHGMPEGWKSPLQDSKEANAARLRELKVDAIHVLTGVGLENVEFQVPAEGEKWARHPPAQARNRWRRRHIRR